MGFVMGIPTLLPMLSSLSRKVTLLLHYYISRHRRSRPFKGFDESGIPPSPTSMMHLHHLHPPGMYTEEGSSWLTSERIGTPVETMLPSKESNEKSCKYMIDATNPVVAIEMLPLKDLFRL